MKEEALKLADDGLNSEGLSYPETWNLCIKQAQRIRRLVEELDYLKDQISFYEIKDLGNKTKPLSDEEIIEIAKQYAYANSYNSYVTFAKAIEKRHGIK